MVKQGTVFRSRELHELALSSSFRFFSFLGENLEALIEQTLEEFFFVETTADNALSKEEFLRNFRAGLRIRHKKWLSAEDLGTVFKILLKLFPNVKLQQNNMQQMYPFCSSYISWIYIFSYLCFLVMNLGIQLI